MSAIDDSFALFAGTILLLSVTAGCPSPTTTSNESHSESSESGTITGPHATTLSPQTPNDPASQPEPKSSPPGADALHAATHIHWQEHHQAGRMTDAARIASQLTRTGNASLDESLSLLAQGQSYPPAKFSRPGPTAMSQAVWHTSRREYEAALERLIESVPASMTPEQRALQGRILAEAQRFDSLPDWIRQTDPTTRQHANFWATLGIWLGHHQQPRAAIGATLQAIRINPTDQLSTQRVGNWLHALGQEHDAERFYQRARLIAETRDLRDQWITLHTAESEAATEADHASPSKNHNRKARLAGQLANALMEAGRPFESFQWRLHQLNNLEDQDSDSFDRSASNGSRTKSTRTKSTRTRRLIHQKIQALSKTPDLAAILAEEHWLQLHPKDFPFQVALKDAIVQQESQAPTPSRALASQESDFPTEDIASQRDSIASYLPKLPDVAQEVGLDFRFRPRNLALVQNQSDVTADLSRQDESLRMHEALGSGIGVLDYDRDGWPDLLFGQGDSEPPQFAGDQADVLYRNLSGHFQEQTESTGIFNIGYSYGIACGDVNQDGFDDLLIANLGQNQLYLNNGDGTFANRTMHLGDQSVGEHQGAFTTSVAIADLNGDQLPDLYEANYVEQDDLFVRLPRAPNGRIPQKTPRSLFAEPDRVWLQDAQGNWRRITIDEAITRPGTGLGLVVGDFFPSPNSSSASDDASDGNSENRLLNEIFVGNDARPNHLLRFDPSQQQWQEIANVTGLANNVDGLPSASMGISAADFDRRGGLDLFITNFSTESVSLYLQNQSGWYSDQCVRQQLHLPTRPMVGFGCKAIDLNRDGWLDVCLVNGHIDRLPGEPYEMPPQCFLSQGFRSDASSDLGHAHSDFSGFVSVIPQSPSDYWTTPALGRTMATFDFDRDHRMDLVVNHLDRDVALLHNECEGSGNWIQLELIGVQSERGATGTHIEMACSDGIRNGYVIAGDGYMCTDENVVEISLGNSDIHALTIHWSSGDSQLVPQANEWLNQRITLVEGQPVWTHATASRRSGGRLLD